MSFLLGKTEDELKESQINYNKGVFPFSANSRARAINHTDGFVKILSDKNSARTNLATPGQETTVIAITMLSIDGFIIATSNIAKTNDGIV